MKELDAHTKTFEQIGHERGLKDDALALKPVAQKDMTDPEVAKAVFAAKTPGLVGPVNGALNWTIAEFKDIVPEKIKPFDEAKADLQKSLGKSKADDLISEATNKFEDMRAGGSTPEEIAQKLNVPLVKYDGVDEQGKDRNGKAVVTGPGAQDILKAAFQSESGVDNDPQAFTDGGQFVVRVDSVASPSLRPFNEIAPQALADYQTHERAVRLKAKAEALVAATSRTDSAALPPNSAFPQQTLPAPLKRGGPNEILGPGLVDALFSARPLSLVIGDAAQPGKLVIATVMRVDRPGQQDIAQGLKELGPQLDSTMSQDLSDAFIDAARQKLKAQVYPAAVDQAVSSTRL